MAPSPSMAAPRLAASDKRQVELWWAFALAGRWVALGAAVAPMVVWPATRL